VATPAPERRILVVDDEPNLLDAVRMYLEMEGFIVLSATRGAEALNKVRELLPDLVILDVMMPEMDGFEVCRRIRATSSVPVLMLTARGELSDRVVGLELGADDYLPKPFEPRELAARLQTILRRARAPRADAPDGVLRFPGLEIDPVRREARAAAAAGAPAVAVPLTGTEFELLLLLAREPQKVFSRDEILNRLRGQDAELFSRAVDILVSRLRRKLEPLECIRTLRNAGYAFALPRLP
jgi:two-component system, OmpR family, response regulator